MSELLTPEATLFLEELEDKFGPERVALLKARQERAHHHPTILTESQDLRRDLSWKVAPPPRGTQEEELKKRWVEILTPVDKRSLVQAFNSGSNLVVADIDESTSPLWETLLEGHLNLLEARKKTLTYMGSDGKSHPMKEEPPPMALRPRGWHLVEKHAKISASLFDVGLFCFHHQKFPLYFSLSKVENHLEARLWNQIFTFIELRLALPPFSIKASIEIDSILAVFELEEILFEMKERSLGLVASQWGYVFNLIKRLRSFKIPFPDKSAIKLEAPFFKAYSDLLVRSCHKRGVHAIGFLSNFVPSRSDPEINKLGFAQLHDEKSHEAINGFDGTRVAHPDLVQLAQAPFEKRSGLRLNQILLPLPPKTITPSDILNFTFPGLEPTEAGVRSNIHLALSVFAAWLAGQGTIKLHHHLESAASAEVARSLLWQWHHHPEVTLKHVGPFTQEVFSRLLKIELHALESSLPPAIVAKLPLAKELLTRLVLEKNLPEWFTLPAYDYI